MDGPKIKEDIAHFWGKVITTEDLQFVLAGHKLKLNCGHQATFGHNFANTVIIVSIGGGKIKTFCHECGY